ncbi:translocon component PTEX88, putative [Plasmodium malariae]|uniref:Translocon component PTEX88, putative n=1 Tax=Plasmodium malariae TaxID=5858 RepID=A0A1C3KCB1_PLAMA|nr:translocon component PTEX88, putative [Plasmodium malariae]
MMKFLILFLTAIFLNNEIACDYSIKHTGELVLANQMNSLVHAKLVHYDKAFKLDLTNLIKFPVQCIPYSTIDHNSKRKKKPVYFIKHEFQNSLYLYKNNVNVMPLIFQDKHYIVGIAVNNGVFIMLTDVDIYEVNTKNKKISILRVADKKYDYIMNNKEMFFTGVVADSIENQFFLICAIKQNYYIVHIRHEETDETVEVLSVIDNINGNNMRVINGISIVEDRLYVAENAEGLYRLTINRDNNTVINAKELYVFKKGDKIVDISADVMPDAHDENMLVDYIVINTKKIVNDKPSSEGCLYLMSVKHEVVDIYTVVDLFSKDVNSFYFTIYDAHLAADDEDTENILSSYKGVSSEKMKFLNLKKEIEEEEMRKKQDDKKYKINIIWTNHYNCTINKGTIDIRNFKVYEDDKKRLPFINVTNKYALAPNVTCASTCSGNEKLFKDICYYDSMNNFVSVLNRSEEYNENYTGNFFFDGLKDFIAFDYKSHMNVHVLSYPLNNSIYVYLDKTSLTINLPKPFGIAIDTYNSTEQSVVVYITGNDDMQNYINKCVISKAEKAYECFNVYRKNNDSNELFQHVSFITYDEGDASSSDNSGSNNDSSNSSSNGSTKTGQVSYIYVTNNKTNIYRLNKQNDKWLLEEWLNLDNPNQRIGPISTSLNYFFIKKNALNNLISKYPEDKLLKKFKDAKDEDLHVTDDGYIFLTVSHTVIFCSNNDSYATDSGSTVHFYSSILSEKYYQSFVVDSIIFNIKNDSKFNYYIDA